ncbi:uncharacterized protein A4U43_C06F2000 [Asparagus officinalis]|uniref:DNA-directed RNA polymerase subunit n=1 Tax=Asparagus officinalis TaxID=4686 RepID=A0A5P1EL09_ASPOF|nr:uncharacterized protein A4U43_C06F2000 [Asparagus officinalis]
MEENVISPVISDGIARAIKFSIATAEEVCKYSINDCPISHPSQLTNPFLGLPLESGKCESCGTAESGNCEGHFGYIELPVPVYHPLHISELRDILSLVCFHCMRTKKGKIKDKAGKSSNSAATSCSHCRDIPPISIKEVKTSDGAVCLQLTVSSKLRLREGFWNFLSKYGFRHGDGTCRTLLPLEALNILKEIPEETKKRLVAKGYFPQDGYILQYLPVPPNCLLVPEISDGKSVMSSDISISLLKRVLSKIELIKRSRSGSPNFESHEVECNDLQLVIAEYMHLRGSAKAPHDVSKKLVLGPDAGKNSSKQWLEKIRTLFISKGSGFSSRSVITGDSYIGINEIGLPSEIAKKVTFEERVTAHNLERLQKMVNDGLCVTYRDGKSTYAIAVGSKAHTILKVGQVISRSIVDGDIVFINRPPSTHKHSLQAFTVYVHDDHTVKINPLVCAPLGADFDGDCVHIFYPQSLAAKAEVVELFSVDQQLLSSHSGQLNFQLVSDSLLSLKLMANSSFLRKEKAQQLGMFVSPVLPPPAVFRACGSGSLWTIYQILQSALPPSVDCTGQRHVINQSEILKFEFNRDFLQSSLTDIITSILVAKGPKAALNFFNSLQPLLMEVLQLEGFSVSLQDFYIPNPVLREVKDGIQDIASFVPQLRMSYDELLGLQVEKDLNRLKIPIVAFILHSSSLGYVIDSKSESSISKVLQQIGFLGLQLFVKGKLYSKALVEDIHHLFVSRFSTTDVSPSSEAHGLVKNPLFHGLNPFEDFVHSISAREVIIRSSRGLTEPGVLFKNLMAILRDVVICYDGTVRNVCSNSIIQLAYELDEARAECVATAGEPVGVLAATAISNPAYKAVLDSSSSTNSSWELMKRTIIKSNVLNLRGSEDCSSLQSNDANLSEFPCLQFSYCAGGVDETLQQGMHIMINTICPILLDTIIKGDPRIDTVNIIWSGPDSTSWVSNPDNPVRGELALEVVVQKVAAKKNGDAWRIVLDACLPVIHLINTTRSIPYGIQQIKEIFGISCAFDQSVQRLSKSIRMVSKGVIKEHLVLVGNNMTCTGNLIGFNTSGFKSLFRSLKVQVPFTEATLLTPMKCFEKAAEKCHTDSLGSIVSSVSWGKHVAVGTGTHFEVIWGHKNQVACNEDVGKDVYDLLAWVREPQERDLPGACLGSDIDDFLDDFQGDDMPLSPEPNNICEKPTFEDYVETESRGNDSWQEWGRTGKPSSSWDNAKTVTESDTWSAWDNKAKPSADTGNKSSWEFSPKVAEAENRNKTSWDNGKNTVTKSDDWSSWENKAKPSTNTSNKTSWQVSPKVVGADIWQGRESRDQHAPDSSEIPTSKSDDWSSWDNAKPHHPNQSAQLNKGVGGWDVKKSRAESSSGWQPSSQKKPWAAEANESWTPRKPETQSSLPWEENSNSQWKKSKASGSSWTAKKPQLEISLGQHENIENNAWQASSEKKIWTDKSNESSWRPKKPEAQSSSPWKENTSETNAWQGSSEKKQETDTANEASWTPRKPETQSSSPWKKDTSEDNAWQTSSEKKPWTDKTNESSWTPRKPDTQTSSPWNENSSEKKGWSTNGVDSVLGGNESEVKASPGWNEGGENPWTAKTPEVETPNVAWGGRGKQGWKSQGRGSSSFSDRRGGRNNSPRPPGPGRSDDRGSWRRAETFTTEEEKILVDIEPIMNSIRKILREASDGNRVSPMDEKFIIENVFEYHPDKQTKVADGLDYIIVDKHSNFTGTRCFYVVSKDGSRADFSYIKCMENFIKGSYPDLAESFNRKFFRRRRSEQPSNNDGQKPSNNDEQKPSNNDEQNAEPQNYDEPKFLNNDAQNVEPSNNDGQA